MKYVATIIYLNLNIKKLQIKYISDTNQYNFFIIITDRSIIDRKFRLMHYCEISGMPRPRKRNNFYALTLPNCIVMWHKVHFRDDFNTSFCACTNSQTGVCFWEGIPRAWQRHESQTRAHHMTASNELLWPLWIAGDSGRGRSRPTQRWISFKAEDT